MCVAVWRGGGGGVGAGGWRAVGGDFPSITLYNPLALKNIRSHNRGRRPQARGSRKTIEKDKCAIFSENCATLSVINSRGYTQIFVRSVTRFKLGSRLDSKARHRLSTKALINPSK